MKRQDKKKTKVKDKGPSHDTSQPVVYYGNEPCKPLKLKKNKTVMLDYYNAKVFLGLEIPNELLFKTVLNMFRRPQFQVRYFSALQFIYNPSQTEVAIYKHKIDTKEALSLLMHLKQKREGNTNLDWQLKQLIYIMKNFGIKEGSIKFDSFDPQLTQELNKWKIQFNQSTQECLERLIEIRNSRKDQLDRNFPHSSDFTKFRFLQIHIRALSLQFFDQIVVGLRQLSSQKVEIIYQQSYPSKTMKIHKLKKIIGEERYFRKRMKFIKQFDKVQKLGINNTNLIICHICKQVIEKEYVRCSNSDMRPMSMNYINSAKIYYRRMIAFDYRYHPQDAHDISSQLDYFKYFSYRNKKKSCNRLFCLKCIEKTKLVDKYDNIVKHNCVFCKKICECDSCLTANELVRCFAYLIDIFERNCVKDTKIYNILMKLVNFEEDDIIQNSFIRNGFRNAEKEDYSKYYHDCLDRFEKVYKVVEKFRSLMVCDQRKQKNPSFILTPENKEICKFYDQSKYGQNAVKVGGISLRAIKESNLAYEKRIGDKTKRKKSIRQKFAQNFEAHNILKKFCVTEQEPLQLPEQLITHEDSVSIQSFLKFKYEKVTDDVIPKLARINDRIPYSKDDYQKMNITSNKYKLYTERELHYQQLLQVEVFYELTHPEYGPIDFGYEAHFEDINKYFRWDTDEPLDKFDLDAEEDPQEGSSSSYNLYNPNPDIVLSDEDLEQNQKGHFSPAEGQILSSDEEQSQQNDLKGQEEVNMSVEEREGRRRRD